MDAESLHQPLQVLIWTSKEDNEDNEGDENEDEDNQEDEDDEDIEDDKDNEGDLHPVGQPGEERTAHVWNPGVRAVSNHQSLNH